MTNELENEESIKRSLVTDYMANERTYLAWVRTSIGLMAFGFVVERFSIFVKQLNYMFSMGSANLGPLKTPFKYPDIALSSFNYSAYLGVLLVLTGAVICFFSYFKYKNVQRQIELECYKPSNILDLTLMLAIMLMAFFLVFYLNHNF